MLLTFLSMNLAFGAVIGTAQVIPRQLCVVNRERGVASSSNVRGVLRGVTRRRVPRGVMITSSREPAERSERSERAE